MGSSPHALLHPPFGGWMDAVVYFFFLFSFRFRDETFVSQMQRHVTATRDKAKE